VAEAPAAAAEAAPSVAADVADTVVGVVGFGAVLHCLHEYVIDISMCCGPSMLPTLNAAGDVVLLDRLSPRLGWIRPGDVVIAKSPTNAAQTVCKRVAARAGDPIPGARDTGGSFFGGGSARAVVPEGHVWLLGDNADNSTDSRYYGPVPAALIKGRVFLRVYPWTKIAWF